MCWLFPGKVVQVDAPCLDCGEPLQVRIKDGEVLSSTPGTIVGYADSELGTPGDFAFK